MSKIHVGSRIKMIRMNDPCHPIEPGQCGTVEHIDDAGQLHMHWDNGRSLAIIPEVDKFVVLNDQIQATESQREKLIELIAQADIEHVNAFGTLREELEHEADFLLQNGVVIFPSREEAEKALQRLMNSKEKT